MSGVLVHIAGVSFCRWMTLSALAVISLVYLASLDIQVCLICFIILIIQTVCSHSLIILFSFLLISEQGRRNDIKKINSIMQASDDIHIVPPPLDVSSDSVHCNALTQSSAVSYAFSCHTTDSCCEDNDDVDSSLALPSPNSKCHSPSLVHLFSKSSSTTVKEDVTSSTALSQGTPLPPQPSWLHVFSKSCSTTSLCTQSAAVAYLDVKSPKVLHRRARRAKKKDLKIQEILREVIVPQGQVTLSCNEIDSEIIVFDGSDVPSNHI